MEAVIELPPINSRNDLFFGQLRAVEEREPDARLGISERLPAGAKKQRVLSLIAKRLAQTDVRAALAMAAGISGSVNRADALDDLGEAADFSQLADLRDMLAECVPRAFPTTIRLWLND